jgi:hypothetical protein
MKALCSLMVKSGSFLLAALVSLLVSCSNEKKAVTTESTLDKMDLNGKVKSLTQIIYDADDQSGEIQKKRMLSRSVYLFNEQGNIVEENYFKPDGSQKSKSTYKYNKKGQIIENLFLKDEGNLVYKVSYEYNTKWQMVKMNHLNYEANSEHSETCKYDKKGNEIERNSYWSDGSLGMIALSLEQDGTIKKEFQKPYGSQANKFLFKYDDKGNRIEEANYRPDGSLDAKRISKFDEKGNKIETEVYNSGGKMIFRSVYKYDEKGHLIGHNDGESDAAMEIVYDKKYDEKGNIIEEIKESDQRKLRVSYKYDSYDKYGNWLVETKTVSSLTDTGKVYSIIINERDIQYH